MVTQAKAVTLLTRSQARALTDCDRCPLGCGARLPSDSVLGEGDPDAALVIVGEAPGFSEIQQGSPFVGASGVLLRAHLRAHGATWVDTYRTNALACMPPKLVTARMLKACGARLAAELDACARKRVILCVGKQAAMALRSEPSSITELNGKVEWNARYGCWVVYAYHPAYVLRNADAATEFSWAIGNAISMLKPAAQPPRLPPLPYVTAQPDDLSPLAAARTQPLIICDIETTGLSPLRDRTLEIGLRWQDAPPLIISADVYTLPAWHETLARMFADRDITFVGHNYKFDVQFLWHAGFDARIGGDTMLLHHCLDERSGSNDDGGWSGGHHDLKTLARYFLGWPDWSEEVDALMHKSGSMLSVPEAQRRQYHAYDLEATWSLWLVLRRRLRAQPQSRAGYLSPLECHDRILVPAANAIARLESRGVRIDRARLDALAHEYVQLAEDAVAEARTHAKNADLNPRSVKQVAAVLYGAPADGGMGYPNLHKTDKLTLHELQRRDSAAGKSSNGFLEATLRARSLATLKSTYLDGIRARMDADGRIRTNLLLHGTVTGRLASRNPNLQNIPADSVIKELFIPSDSMVMANADYKQLEVRALAYYSRDPALCTALRASDFHWEVCKVAFAEIAQALTAAHTIADLEAVARSTVMFDEFVRRQALPYQRTDDFAVLFGWLKTRLRRKAKFVTFGNIYGEGPEALSRDEKGLGCTVAEAKRFQSDWRATYAVAAHWLDHQTTLANADGWVEAVTGRRRRFGPGSRSIATESRNHPVQAFASDINLMSLVQLEESLPALGYGYPLMPVHDSILFELWPETLAQARAHIEQTMRSVVVSSYVLFDVDFATGASWGACH